MGPKNAKDKIQHPRKNANPFSIATFSWTIPIFVKGFKKVLEEEDLFGPLKDHESQGLGNKLETSWKTEKKSSNPSLWKALIRVFGWRVFFLGFVALFLEIFVKIAEPLALGKLLDFFTSNDANTSRDEAYAYASLIAGSSILYVIISHLYSMENQHLGLQMRVAVSSLIYRKSLKLSQASFENISSGQLVNLLSNDIDRFDSLLLHIHSLWICPVEIIFILILMYFHLGLTATCGSLLLIVVLPLQVFLGKLISLYRLKTAECTDRRVRLMEEIIGGINVIKMYSWENFFVKLVEFARKEEISQISASATIKGITLSLRLFAIRASIFLSIMAYVLTGNEINATYVFVVTSYYNILRKTLILQLPCGIKEFAEGFVSVQRIKSFLLSEEINDFKQPNAIIPIDENSNKSLYEKTPKLVLKNVSAKWPSSTKIKDTLSNINVEITKNTLTAIVGNVGSGKSSLLLVILNELKISDGHLNILGKISYAPQEPWLFSGTVRDNIIFGSTYEEKMFRKVLEVCALEEDLLRLPRFDQTFVGEKGVSLSGGQRARINLARAVYKKADIYLLDDPLSAVDSKVSKHIFENCIKEFLKNKCVLLITHQIQYLEHVDEVITMDSGTIKYQGPYQNIKDIIFGDGKNITRQESTKEDGESTKKENVCSSNRSLTKDDPDSMESKEFKNVGNISLRDYLAYITSGGSICFAVFILLLFMIMQGSSSGADYFVTYWVNVQQDHTSSRNDTVMSETEKFTEDNGMLALGAVVSFNILISIFSSVLFYWFSIKAAKNLHHKMFSKVIFANLIFFNTNPSGRILNRFSKDMGNIDEKLPDVIVDLIHMGLSVMGTIIIIIIVNHWIVFVAAAMLVIFYFLRRFYLSTSLSLKRLEGVTRSPIYTHLNASLQGLTTIRAFGAEENQKNSFDYFQNFNSSATYFSIACTRAFGFWLDLICAIFISSVTFSFLMMKNVKHSGSMGLAITQASGLTKMFQKWIRQWSELDNQMISVERVSEYTRIENEFENRKEVDLPNPEWPTKGSIEFKSVCFQYTEKSSWIFKDLNFYISPKEKVGVIGRTGAGKSSLISVLFQLYQHSGQIIIDNVDITKIPLDFLRSKISIIPQEPIIFSGTVRKNLDPFGTYSDVLLWSALQQVELKQTVGDLGFGLDSKILEGGVNFSVGQRQLLCLARAIIRNSKILILDEATACVDQKTDKLIQKTIRSRFKDCTVLTIAHRLHTVMDYDKILVIEDGSLVQFGHPHVLLQDQEGLLYKFVKETGKNCTENLLEIAKQAYDANQCR